MKQIIFFFLTIISQYFFSQEVLQKTFETNFNEIELITYGLDEIKIINTNSNKIEVSLYDENPNSHTISIEEKSKVLKISFELLFHEEATVFKKFITKRLHRASAIIKIPKNKHLTLHGDYIDVISESYQGDIEIYINKGLVKFQECKGNVILKLFQGNVFATVSNFNIDVISKKGKINVNDTLYPKKYQKEIKNSKKHFKLNSIHANVNLNYNFK